MKGAVSGFKGLLVLLELQVALGSVAVDDAGQGVVGLGDVGEAAGVAVDGLFVVEAHEEGVALLLELVGAGALLD